MAMEYLTNLNYEKLAPVLEECASWFTQIAISVAYPERDTQLDKIKSPVSFNQWLFDANEEAGTDQNVINEIHHIYSDMINVGENIVEELRSNTKPDFEGFELFKGLYNGFVARLRWLETGSLMSGSGVCPETGFRSRDAILPDQKKEMERLKRQGTAFCCWRPNV